MPKIELPEKYLRRVRELLEQYVPKAEVWAYESRINGEVHAASDLDLVVRNLLDSGSPVPNIHELRNALTESDIPILVDVLDWAELPASFSAEIEKNYVVVKG